ncbi:hypothetical protein N9E28_00900 [Alphaproteobacteria bacterium]|nr:hypothetical protein [Alphaproteobacteria bacterium]
MKNLIRFYASFGSRFYALRFLARWFRPLTRIQKLLLSRHYSRISKDIATCEESFGNQKVIALFLQYQPEASTMPKGGVFYDQKKLIAHLAGKKKFSLIVREHPNQFSAAFARQPERYRNKSFYSCENVHWHSLEETPFQLIDRADVVLSVGGTVNLEAAIRGTLSVSLGKSFLTEYCGIQLVSSYGEIDTFLENVFKSPDLFSVPTQIGASLEQMSWLDEKIIPAVIGGHQNLKLLGLTEEQNVRNLERAFHEFLLSLYKKE